MNTTLDLSEINIMIGQLFMIGMPGPELDSGTEALIRDWRIGGLILFSRNIKTPDQLKKLCWNLQEISINTHGVPVFIAVDQEGGRVSRLKEPFTQFEGNESIGMADKPENEALRFARITAEEMKQVGLNMNLAPVLDVMREEVNECLIGRMFGGDPEVVSMLGAIVIEELQANGIISVAKHFPGLGAVPKDPHRGLPVINSSKEELYGIDILPYESAIRVGVSGIMTSHAIYPSIDESNPATTSQEFIQNLLRKELSFQGIVITDDLEMGAMKERYGSVSESAYQAVIAGADMLIIAENQSMALESMKLLRGSLLKGRLDMERVYLSNKRIMDIKKQFLYSLFTH
jgi:beta-N-acetylhexosaminidase